MRPSAQVSKRALAAVAVFLAAAVPYLPTLHNYFVADDFGVVQLLSQTPRWHFPQWFVTSWMDSIWGFTPDEIRPFPALSYQLTALWGAASPVANHVMNIAIHTANALLVLAVARTVAGLSLSAATFAAVVFALLPIQAESVAWITGRVDTIPAFFYIGSFLAYTRWRAAGSESRRLYACSVLLFFAGLFSKQNALTMLATLVLYDLLLERRTVRIAWTWLRPYAPFAALTTGYLLLRYVLFGNMVREDELTPQLIDMFLSVNGRHLRRLVLGDAGAGSALEWLAAFALAGGVWLVALTSRAGERGRISRAALYFGPVWGLLGVLPILAAGYDSPRHVYLASVGWATLLGLAAEVLWRTRPSRIWRTVVVIAGGGLLVVYSSEVAAAVADWNTRAAVSQKAVADLQREALTKPEGSLLIVGTPVKSWEWAMPFVAQPPYTETDLTKRVFIVSPRLLSCCRLQWPENTASMIRRWSARRDRPPVVALSWNAQTGALTRTTDREDPELRRLVFTALKADTPEELDENVLTVIGRVGKGSGPVDRGLVHNPASRGHSALPLWASPRGLVLSLP